MARDADGRGEHEATVAQHPREAAATHALVRVRARVRVRVRAHTNPTVTLTLRVTLLTLSLTEAKAESLDDHVDDPCIG